MKANEFIKKFGIFGAKEYLAGATFFDEHLMVFTDTNELKRLIESHELIVNDFESIEIAEYEYMVSGCYSEPYWIRIKQAIADVESCL